MKENAGDAGPVIPFTHAPHLPQMGLAAVRTLSPGDTLSSIFLLTEAVGKLIQGYVWGLGGAELNPGLWGHKDLSAGFMALPVL